MKNKFLQYLFLSCSLMLLLSACRKDNFKGKETLQAGKTYVWITEAPANNQFFDVFTDIKTVHMFSVRRDAASNADLKKAVTVTLSAIPMDEINAKNGTDYTVLPSSIFTLVPEAGVSITDAGISINFASGDFAKQIAFNIDGSKVDLSKQYAVAYAITSFGGLSKKIGTDTILATIAIKNKYDGIYSATGTLVDITNKTITDFNDYLTSSGDAPTPMQYELRTVSATSNVAYDNYYFGGNYFAINSNGAASQYGNFDPIFTFDPATNKVIAVTDFYGQGTNSQKRSAQLDPSGINAYDPASKTIKVKFFMLQPGVAGVPPSNIRTSFDYTFTYLGSR